MQTFRVVTQNLMGLGEPMSRRLELVQRVLSELEPDAIALQEVCESASVRNQAATLAEALGLHHVFAPAKTMAGQLVEGLAILSRHPIREHASHPLPSDEAGRIVLMAVLDLPVGPLRLFNTHFDYGPERGVTRERQVVQVEHLVRAQPSELPSVLVGDFNATPEHDEIRFLRGRHSLEGRRAYLHDAFARLHPVEHRSGATWSQRNPLTRRWRMLEADRRIDYVFVSRIDSNGVGDVTEARLVLDQPDDEGQFPSDHFGVLAELRLTPASTDG